MSALTKEELRARVLALVLAAVLVWYTSVVPSGPPFVRASRPRRRGGDARGGESRRGDTGAAATDDDDAGRETVADLDWPEYIYPD